MPRPIAAGAARDSGEEAPWRPVRIAARSRPPPTASQPRGSSAGRRTLLHLVGRESGAAPQSAVGLQADRAAVPRTEDTCTALPPRRDSWYGFGAPSDGATGFGDFFRVSCSGALIGEGPGWTVSGIDGVAHGSCAEGKLIVMSGPCRTNGGPAPESCGSRCLSLGV
jgi:hypothetical protein